MLSSEVRESFLSYFFNVPFIRHLCSEDRVRASDCVRMDDGRIVVDLERPHILEGMDYFRPSAIHFEKHGCYTFLVPNSNPQSEYGKWLIEEVRRCREGYVRDSDGEWITGDYYFFLNYCPIQLTKPSKDGKGKSVRVIGFPRVWDGHYLRSHYLARARDCGSHAAELASRGKGKSFYASGMLAKRILLGESDEVCKRVQCVVTASEKKYILGANQVLNMFQSYLDHCAKTTEFPSRRLVSSASDMQWTMGYRDVDTGVVMGSENSVTGITSKDDESKLRGSRGVLYLIEEAGSFPRLLKLFNVLRPSVEDGSSSFGLIYAYGTAGDQESDFHAMQEMMYNPDGYNIYGLNNVFDKVNDGKKRFSFFFPAYMNMNGYYDKDGNSDVVGALLAILQDREHVKHNSTDPFTITKRVAEYPIVPKEAILNVGNSMFPVVSLTNRLTEIDSDSGFYDDVYCGDLVITGSGKVEFIATQALPIRSFPHRDGSITGSLEVFTLPEKGSDGEVFSGRYIASLDPYENDQSDESSSLGSFFILDLWTDRIVAEYTGRPQFADDLYELVRKACLFFNARLNYENNKKGLFAYFQQHHCLHLLTDTLEFLRDKQMIKSSTFGNTSKGTYASAVVNSYARDLIRKWLLKPVPSGGDDEILVPNLNFIRNRALLQELIGYNSYGNFDRVSSLGMLMLLREDWLIKTGGDVVNKSDDKEYLGNDDYFTKNYRGGDRKSAISY